MKLKKKSVLFAFLSALFRVSFRWGQQPQQVSFRGVDYALAQIYSENRVGLQPVRYGERRILCACGCLHVPPLSQLLIVVGDSVASPCRVGGCTVQWPTMAERKISAMNYIQLGRYVSRVLR